MFPKHFSLKEDTDKHYTIHDSRDNKSFKVSKKDLHPAHQLKILKNLPKFAEGGDVGSWGRMSDQDSRGGKDTLDQLGLSESPDVAARQAARDQEFQGRVAMQNTGRGPQDVALPETAQPTQDVPRGTVGLPPEALVQAEPSAPVQAQAPGVPSALMDPLGAMQKSNQLGLKAANEQYQAEAGKAQAEVKNQQEYGQQLKDIYNDHFVKSAETKDRLETLFNEANSGEIDPDRYWNSKSTGSKISSVLGIILGGLGQGLTGSNVNVAMKVINDGIDRDIDAQKANKSQKNNLYHMYLDKYKNEEDAYSRTKADMLTLAAAKTSMIAAQAGTPMAAAARDYMKAQLGQQAAQYGMQYAGAGLARKAVTEGIPVEAMSYLPEKQRENMVRLPNGMMADAGNSKNAEEYTAKTEAFHPLMQDLTRLKQLNSISSTWNPAQREAAGVLQNHIVIALNELAKSRRITEGDIGFQKGQLSDPTSIKNKLSTDWNAGTDELISALTRQYQAVAKGRVPALGNMETKNAQVRASIPTKAR